MWTLEDIAIADIIFQAWKNRQLGLAFLKAGPDDATLLLGQGTESSWSIGPRCPRVLQVLSTMSDSSQ